MGDALSSRIPADIRHCFKMVCQAGYSHCYDREILPDFSHASVLTIFWIGGRYQAVEEVGEADGYQREP
jgi:hypothetical protein